MWSTDTKECHRKFLLYGMQPDFLSVPFTLIKRAAYKSSHVQNERQVLLAIHLFLLTLRSDGEGETRAAKSGEISQLPRSSEWMEEDGKEQRTSRDVCSTEEADAGK